MKRRISILTTSVAALALVACSSERSVSPASTPTSAASTTTVGSTTPETTLPATTETPTTVGPSTTVPSGGWVEIDVSTYPAPLAFPCCASNWYGVPSPALPAAGAPLADGAYLISFDWPDEPSLPITAEVSRLESCNVLPAGSCEENGGGSYMDDEMGVDTDSTYQLSLTLDGSLQVVLGGFTGGDSTNTFAMGTGTDLAALLSAVDADYQTAILQPHADGMSRDQIIDMLTTEPAYGFGPPAQPYAGALAYTFDGAPPLLFQSLPGVDEYDESPDPRGSNVLGRISLLVEGGQLTLTVYSGFYS
ncbi:MAG: hypothetical protein Q7V88_04885 [Actinomycetota bacterium]|nr:hypothetical protein [Actinomycetota bacterium]